MVQPFSLGLLFVQLSCLSSPQFAMSIFLATLLSIVGRSDSAFSASAPFFSSRQRLSYSRFCKLRFDKTTRQDDEGNVASFLPLASVRYFWCPTQLWRHKNLVRNMRFNIVSTLFKAVRNMRAKPSEARFQHREKYMHLNSSATQIHQSQQRKSTGKQVQCLERRKGSIAANCITRNSENLHDKKWTLTHPSLLACVRRCRTKTFLLNFQCI